MNVPALLQVAGLTAGVVGVFLLAGIGWTLIAACVACVAVGVALEREQARSLHGQLEQATAALQREGG